jgi:tRNA dimethylallyltransferase
MLPLIILTGPTGSGKSATALELANKLESEIVSADSMQVYKYFDIGTAKPSRETRRIIPHHLIDILEPDEKFNAYEFKTQALDWARNIASRGKVPLIVGGTGLYLTTLMLGYDCAVMVSPEINSQVKSEIDKWGPCRFHEELEEIDPESAENISCNDSLRIQRALAIYRQTGTPLSQLRREGTPLEEEFDVKFFLLQWDRESLYRNVEKRIDSMILEGWIDEVKELLERKISQTSRPFQSIGYPQLSRFLNGEMPLDQAVKIIKQETRRYVKRQTTWFKKMPNHIPVPVSPKDNPSMIKDKIFSKVSGLISFLIVLIFSFLNPNFAVSEVSKIDQAVVLSESGNFSKANQVLSEYLETDLSTDKKGPALLLSGMVLNQSGNHLEAVNRLKESLDISSAVEGYQRYELAKALFHLNKFESALEQVKKSLEDKLILGVFPKAVLLKVNVLEKLNKNSEAILFLNKAIKKISSNKAFLVSIFMPQLLFKHGNLLETQNKLSSAFNIYKKVYVKYPLSKEATLAFDRMSKIKSSPKVLVQDIQSSGRMMRVKVLSSRAQFEKVVNEIEANPRSLNSIESFIYLANAYRKQRKRDEAAKIFREILEKFPNGSKTQKVLFESARNLWNLDQNIEAAKIFRKAIRMNSTNGLGMRARFFLGRVFEADGKTEEAIKEYRELEKRRGQYAEEGAWRIGWLSYISGRYKEAEKNFQSNIDRFKNGDLLEANIFWKAKSLEKTGNSLKAAQAYKEVSFKFPFTYYGTIASNKLVKTSLSRSPKQVEFSSIQPISLSSDPSRQEVKEPKLGKNSQERLKRVRILVNLRLNDSAVFEIRHIERKIQKTFSGTLWIADLYGRAGAYKDSQRLLELFARFKTKMREKDLPQIFWRRYFPLVFKQDIYFQAKVFNVDPFMATSVIRQESMFDHNSMSVVGARGLMQIMPHTGERFYQIEKDSPEFQPNLLFDPIINIRIGTKYLKELDSQYNGNWVKILSCYNAGPEAVANWEARFPETKDPDEFVERIPFPETRKFVKRVLRNRGVYRALYEKNLAT